MNHVWTKRNPGSWITNAGGSTDSAEGTPYGPTGPTIADFEFVSPSHYLKVRVRPGVETTSAMRL